jgi:hypothetical protein
MSAESIKAFNKVFEDAFIQETTNMKDFITIKAEVNRRLDLGLTTINLHDIPEFKRIVDNSAKRRMCEQVMAGYDRNEKFKNTPITIDYSSFVLTVNV